MTSLAAPDKSDSRRRSKSVDPSKVDGVWRTKWLETMEKTKTQQSHLVPKPAEPEPRFIAVLRSLRVFKKKGGAPAKFDGVLDEDSSTTATPQQELHPGVGKVSLDRVSQRLA